MSSFNPLVSIIIPVYNGSDFLREAIESALNQSYIKLEVIVINDGSVDEGETESIALSFGNKIKYFKKENGGVSSALNLGIKKMSGQYFSWLSHDDLYQKDKIKKQIDFLTVNKTAKIVGCNFSMLIHNSNDSKNFMIKKSILENGIDILSNWIHFCCLLVEKKTLTDAGFFNELNRTCQDTEMLFNLILKNNIFFIDDLLVIRREHDNQGSRLNLNAHLKDKNDFYSKLIKKFGYKVFQNKTENLSKYSILCLLGDRCMKLGLIKVGKDYFKKAFFLKPISPKLVLFILFGKAAWKIFEK